MSSKFKLIVGGVVTYASAVAIGYYYTSSKKPSHPPHAGPCKSGGAVALEDSKRQSTYASLAKKYDTEIGTDEVLMGLSLIRWWNIRQAKGKVLEIGCGTGRNFPFYNMKSIEQLTAVDSVAEMVEVSRTKISSSDKEKISLMQMNAHDLNFPDDSFDFVIDTFGICSYENPQRVLSELGRVLNKRNPEARILLIEHGKASYDWLNNLLDAQAQQHADNWGCIWNLDIEKVVRSSGLQITSLSRFHFGTTYGIQARPAARKEDQSSP